MEVWQLPVAPVFCHLFYLFFYLINHLLLKRWPPKQRRHLGDTGLITHCDLLTLRIPQTACLHFFLQLFNQCNSLTICQRTAALWWDGHSDMRRRARRTHMPPLCHFHATTIWKQLVSPDLSQLFPIWNVPTEICERERKRKKGICLNSVFS